MDNSTSDLLVSRMERTKKVMCDSIDSYIKHIRNRSSTHESITKAKGELLKSLVSALPLGAGDCAYCIDTRCIACPFGKVQGICLDSESKYQKVQRAKRKLKESLKKA